MTKKELVDFLNTFDDNVEIRVYNKGLHRRVDEVAYSWHKSRPDLCIVVITPEDD